MSSRYKVQVSMRAKSRLVLTLVMLFQCYVQRLFSVDERIVLLEENRARNPEFDYDRFESADMDNSRCKAN